MFEDENKRQLTLNLSLFKKKELILSKNRLHFLVFLSYSSCLEACGRALLFLTIKKIVPARPINNSFKESII